MKTPEEWTREIVKRGEAAVSYFFMEKLAEAIAQIQAEAAAHAIRNVPPLPMLRVDDEDEADFQTILNYFRKYPLLTENDNDPVLMSQSVWKVIMARWPDLLADRETLLRMLGDCDGLDAYVKGYEAGKAAAAKVDGTSES